MFVHDLVSMLPLSRPDPDPPPLNLPPDPLVMAPRLNPPDPPDPSDPPDLSLSQWRPSFYVGGPPHPKFSDLLNRSIPLAILLCALDIKWRYDFLFSLNGSFMSLVDKYLALVRFTTAVCSLSPSLTQDIESLMIIYSCELLSSMVDSSSPAFCLDRSLFSALSCSTAFMLLMSLGLSYPLAVPVFSPCCYDSTGGYIGDTLVVHVKHFTAVFRPLLVFILEFDVISGYVVGSIVSKLTDTLLSSLHKGLANWCHVTYALVAVFLIVHSTYVVVSISGYRSLNVLSKSHSSISSLTSFDVEVRGLPRL